MLTDKDKGQREKIRKDSRYASQERNPCLKESEMSLQCMNDSDYDRDKCTLQFMNYRNCLDFWTMIRRDRRKLGISPDLPPLEERAQIRAEYLNKSARK